MIKGVRAMFYTPDAEALRAFLRDQLDLPFTDTGGGWLIFRASEVEIGCHPWDRRFQGFSFYCDDLKRTTAALRRRGVEFTADTTRRGLGMGHPFQDSMAETRSSSISRGTARARRGGRE